MKRIQHPYFAKEFQKVDQHLQPVCVICEEKLRGMQRRFCSPKCSHKHQNLQYKNECSTYGTGILSLDYDPNNTFAGSYDEYPIDQGILQLAEANETAFKLNQEALIRVGKSSKGKERYGRSRKPRKNTLNSFD